MAIRTLEEEIRLATHVSTPVTIDTEDARMLGMTSPSRDQTPDEDGSDWEEAVGAVGAMFGITDAAKQQRMTRRIIRLVDSAYENMPTPSMDEYISVLKESAKGMGQRYWERKNQRDTDTASVCLSRPSEVARAIDSYALRKRAIELDSREPEDRPESSRMEIMMPSDARTGITGTTSPGRRTVPIYLPLPPEWADRVNAQRATRGPDDKRDREVRDP